MSKPKLESIKIKFHGKTEKTIKPEKLEKLAGVFFGDHGVLEVLADWYEKVKGDKTTADRIRKEWMSNPDVIFYSKDIHCAESPED